jgi:hypothetical protein
MVPQGLMDAPWHIDAMLALILAGAAIAQYVAIAIDGHSFAKWLMAIGWTGLTIRFVVALTVYGNVTINTASIPFLLCIAGGTMIGVINTIVRAGKAVPAGGPNPRGNRATEATKPLRRSL